MAHTGLGGSVRSGNRRSGTQWPGVASETVTVSAVEGVEEVKEVEAAEERSMAVEAVAAAEIEAAATLPVAHLLRALPHWGTVSRLGAMYRERLLSSHYTQILRVMHGALL